MKKILVILLSLFIFTSGICVAKAATTKAKPPYRTKVVETTLPDKFVIKSRLLLPKAKDQKYPLVIFLHSLGYSSSHWGTVPQTFAEQGYAVLLIDLRGHGKSNKYLQFKQYSWRYFSPKSFAKYPSDVKTVLEHVKKSNKRIDFSKYSIIGGDIGANTGVLVASTNTVKPKSMVLLTPSITIKGLEIASLYKKSAISSIGSTPILAICSQKDANAIHQENLLKKFASGKFETKNVEQNTNGMLLLKYNEDAQKEVIKFINQNMPAPKPASNTSTTTPTKK